MRKLAFKLCVMTITLLFCSVISLGQQLSANADVPNGWKKINAEGLFTFYLPSGAWDTGFIGTDEFYREYRIGKMRFKFVYEPMGVLAYNSREKEFGRGFRETVIEVGRRKAYLFDYAQTFKGRKEYYTALFVGDLPHRENKLWMQAESSRPADLAIAKKIFRTIEFTP